MDPTEILRSAGGVLLRRDVLAAGATDTELRRAVRTGQVLRLDRGLLAVADADAELVAAGRARGLITCVSAAPVYGLWQLRPPARPHYWQSNGRSAVPCISHRTDLTQPPRHRTLAALPDVLLHALLCLPELESLVMVECAYNRGDIDPPYLFRHLDGPRCGKARDVVSKVDRGADSLLETLARVLAAGTTPQYCRAFPCCDSSTTTWFIHPKLSWRRSARFLPVARCGGRNQTGPVIRPAGATTAGKPAVWPPKLGQCGGSRA
jgi:hypothetical protein